MKKASIIIPTKDKLSRLRLVLKALEAQVTEAVEVIVIFDGCRQDTLHAFNDIKLKYTPVQIVHEENLGRARARNSGIRQATGDIVIFLDDDRIPCPDFVHKHVKRHENGRYAVIGERNDIEYSEEMLYQLYKNGFTPSVFLQMQKDARKEPHAWIKKASRQVLGQLLESVTFTTGNSSVQRRDLLKTGMFDKNFSGWGVEDMDLGYRLVKDGVKVVRDYSIANYHLVHPVNPSAQKEEYWKNLYYFLDKIKEDKTTVCLAKFLSNVLYGRM